MDIWVVVARSKNRVIVNQGYRTSAEAKASVFKQVGSENIKIIDDYNFLDLENDLVIELKSVTVF